MERLGVDDLRPNAQQFYPGKIVLFRASDVVQISGTEPSLGWNAVAKDGVVVEFAPGDHESMFRDPHLPKFGKMLERVMREGEAAHGFAAGASPVEASA
jgi:thioesterase domain-containing protein